MVGWVYRVHGNPSCPFPEPGVLLCLKRGQLTHWSLSFIWIHALTLHVLHTSWFFAFLIYFLLTLSFPGLKDTARALKLNVTIIVRHIRAKPVLGLVCIQMPKLPTEQWCVCWWLVCLFGLALLMGSGEKEADKLLPLPGRWRWSLEKEEREGDGRGEGGRWRECRKEREGEVMGQAGNFGLTLYLPNHTKIQPKANLRGVTISLPRKMTKMHPPC